MGYQPATGTFRLMSDEAARPRMYDLILTLGPPVDAAIPGQPLLLQAPATGRSFDGEGLALAPDGRFFVSSEGDEFAMEDELPGIFEYAADGTPRRRLRLPAAWAGVRTESGVEGLALSPDGVSLAAVTEAALRQDGPIPDFKTGSVSRILVLDLTGRARPREYAYPVDPIPAPAGAVAPTGNVGASELLWLGKDELLVLERSFVEDRTTTPELRANTIRIYRVTLDPAAEVTGRWSVVDEPPATTLKKELFVDLGMFAAELPQRLRMLENFEGMTFGPPLPDGRQTLVLVSDDNFRNAQVTAVVVLAVGR